MASGVSANGGSVSVTRQAIVRAISRTQARHGKSRPAVVSAFNSGSPTIKQPMMKRVGPMATASDMGASCFRPALPQVQRFNYAGGELIESRHSPAAQGVSVLENDAAEFAGGTIRCIRYIVERDDDAVLGIIRARRKRGRDRCRRFVR